MVFTRCSILSTIIFAISSFGANLAWWHIWVLVYDMVSWKVNSDLSSPSVTSFFRPMATLISQHRTGLSSTIWILMRMPLSTKRWPSSPRDSTRWWWTLSKSAFRYMTRTRSPMVCLITKPTPMNYPPRLWRLVCFLEKLAKRARKSFAAGWLVGYGRKPRAT